MLNEQEHNFKEIVYMLTEPLSTIFEKNEYTRISDKLAKNPYSDRHRVKIYMNIIRNTNDFDKIQADWYGKISGKQTWEYFKTHFEAYLRRLQKKRGNTMWCTAYYQANLLQGDTTPSHIRIIQYSKEPYHWGTQIPQQIKGQHITRWSSKQCIKNTKWCTINSYSVYSSAHQGGPKYEILQNNNRQNKNNTDNQTTYWDGVTFWEKPGWWFKYCWTCGSSFD